MSEKKKGFRGISRTLEIHARNSMQSFATKSFHSCAWGIVGRYFPGRKKCHGHYMHDTIHIYTCIYFGLCSTGGEAAHRMWLCLIQTPE